MKKLVLGNGYIGSAYKENGYDSSDLIYDGKNFIDFEWLCKDYDVIVNCIAKTDTKWTELPENFDEIWDTNVDFVKKLSKLCKLYDKKFVHISTGDLYGNNHNYHENIESNMKLDVETVYRFSKLASEKVCNINKDLILRIRLPFDNRNHPKNLVMKCKNYKKFYAFPNVFTYIPDLIKLTNILIDKNEHGIFNVVQKECGPLLRLLQDHPNYTHLADIDMKDENDERLIHKPNTVHIHNDINSTKAEEFIEFTKLESAFLCCLLSLDQ